MEPVSTITGAWSIAKAAGEVSKKLYELGKSLKEREHKQQLDEILDSIRELKQSASQLEDENRDLREKLRFKSDEYEFRNPFWYNRSQPDRPLCPICFAKNVPAPMSELQDEGMSSESRLCLVCRMTTRVRPFQHRPSPMINTNPFG